MPLDKSGNNSSIGNNVRTLKSEKYPQRQAIAIALDIARRAKRASGGRMAYADGGSSNRNMSRAISERAMRGLDPTPEQQEYLDSIRAIKEENSGRLAGALPTIGNEVAKALFPPVVPGWNVPTEREYRESVGAKLRSREGMTPNERAASLAGEYAGEALPYALPEIGAGIGAMARAFPKTTGTLAGGLGFLSSPAAAGETKEQIIERQRALAKAGFYKGDIDGNDGPATKEAQRLYDQSKVGAEQREIERLRVQAELAKANAASKETERKTSAGELAEEKRRKGEERFQEAEKSLDPFNRVVRDWGPTAGYVAGTALGMLGKWGVNRASNKMSKLAADRADELIRAESGDLAKRAANVNQFWSEGQGMPLMGKRSMPFEADPGKVPAMKSNASAAPSSELYLPSRAKNLGVDLGVAGAFGGESLYAQEVMGPKAEKELADARAAFKEDPSESNLARLQTALNQAATAEALTNLGRAGGISYLASGIKMHRKPTRPNISAAEAERTRIDEILAGKSAPGAGPSVPALPPPTPPGAQSLPTVAPPSPGPTPNPSATSIPSLRAGTASPGKSPSSEATDGALMSPMSLANVPKAIPEIQSGAGAPFKFQAEVPAAPEVRLVPVPYRVSPSGRKNYAKGTPEELGVRPGGFVKAEHLPPKQKVTRKKAASKPSKKTESPQEDDVVPSKPDMPIGGDFGPFARGGVVGAALRIARNMGGRAVLTGPVTHRADGGRTDTVQTNLPSHSYVIPADIVSSLGEGDTNAGYNVLESMFGPHETSGDTGEVPAIVAGGEYVLSPEQVVQIGGGDPEMAFKALDQWVKMQRRNHIQTLKGLPPPVKD